MPGRPTYPIETPRLILRPLEAADAPALLAYHSIPEVHRYLPFGAMDAQAVQDRLAASWSGSTLTAEGDIISLGAALASNGALIGDLMLRWVSERHQGGELGYVFSPDYAGQGYATEAARAVLALAFDHFDLHRMIARIDPRNTASVRLVQRLGLRHEATLIENYWDTEGWTDEVDFAILRREWAGEHR
jgi:RimJ/RimL family protein N-acetyltransferase